MKQYGIVESDSPGHEGFYWMIACDLHIMNAPQDGPFDTYEEAEMNVRDYLQNQKEKQQ